jgi:hypothetical protein
MREFYRLRASKPGMTEAEAFQRCCAGRVGKESLGLAPGIRTRIIGRH